VVDEGYDWLPVLRWGVPLWPVPVAVVTASALLFGAAIVRQRRGLAGVCSCGYDLTGNVSGVCPECGMAIRNSVARTLS